MSSAGRTDFYDMPQLDSAALCGLFDCAEQAGGEARLVGGIVRNWYAGWALHPSAPDAHPDIDMAVNLPIEIMASAAQKAGYSVYETGIAHGTVTLRKGRFTAEVTRLRSDSETDGRHAVIVPIESWEEDAKRRDFTINALYLDRHGQLYDPVGGCADLAVGCLRFIGRPEKRLTEDHLRLLRAVRFCSEYPVLQMDDETCRAIFAGVASLPMLSAERVASEMRRIVTGPAADKMIGLLHEMGVDKVLFDTPFASVTNCWPHHGLLKEGLLSGLIGPVAALGLQCEPGQRAGLAKRLKLSRADSRMLAALDKELTRDAADRLCYDAWQQQAFWLKDAAGPRYLDACVMSGTTADYERLRQIVFFTPPSCPISGTDIEITYHTTGIRTGQALAALTKRWVESGFTARRGELLNQDISDDTNTDIIHRSR